MNKVWRVNLESCPGNGVQTTDYKTFEQAYCEIRKKICELMDIKDYLNELRNHRNPVYGAAMADYFEKYFTDPEFPRSESDIPSCELNDYPYTPPKAEKKTEKKYSDEDWDSDSFDFEDECDEDDAADEEPFEIYISNEGLSLETTHTRVIDTNIISCDEDLCEIKDYEFSFVDCYERDKSYNKTTELFIKLTEEIVYTPVDYPFMVLNILIRAEKPLMIEQLKSDGYDLLYYERDDISTRIYSEYNVKIDRKAIGRHIEMLQNLGYDIKKCAEGYYLYADKMIEYSENSRIVNCIKQNDNLNAERKAVLIDALNNFAHSIKMPNIDTSNINISGSCAYPFIILDILMKSDTPLLVEKKKSKGKDVPLENRDDIISRMQKNYNVKAERKAINRHVSLLKFWNYDIRKCKDGYYINKINDEAFNEIVSSINASADLDENEQQYLIDKLKKSIK